MHEAVGERGGHGRRNGAVLRPVAGRADVPSVRNLVELAETAVEDELVGRDLERAVGRRELVEEDDSAALRVAGPIARDEPFYAIVTGDGKTADVYGFALRESDVDETDAAVVGGLADDARLAESRRAPDHQRRQRLRQRGVLLQGVQLQREDPLQPLAGYDVVHIKASFHSWLVVSYPMVNMIIVRQTFFI